MLLQYSDKDAEAPKAKLQGMKSSDADIQAFEVLIVRTKGLNS